MIDFHCRKYPSINTREYALPATIVELLLLFVGKELFQEYVFSGLGRFDKALWANAISKPRSNNKKFNDSRRKHY